MTRERWLLLLVGTLWIFSVSAFVYAVFLFATGRR